MISYRNFLKCITDERFLLKSRKVKKLTYIRVKNILYRKTLIFTYESNFFDQSRFEKPLKPFIEKPFDKLDGWNMSWNVTYIDGAGIIKTRDLING